MMENIFIEHLGFDLDQLFLEFENKRFNFDFIDEFEHRIARFIGTKYALVTSSGTAALTLSLKSLNCDKNSEIIVPACTFPATVNPVAHIGAKPIFIDIEIETYSLEYSLIENKINKQTKAIILVHQFGFPAKYTNEIVQIGKVHNIPVIEDVARSFGATISESKCGSLGLFGCFSFNSMKVLSTATGGAITTNDEQLYLKCKTLRGYGDVNKVFIEAGYNFNIGQFNAFIGILRMNKLEKNIEQRRFLARLLNYELSHIPNISLPKYNSDYVYQSFPIILKNKSERNDFISFLKQKNIKAYINQVVNCEPYFSNVGVISDNFPNSHFVNEHIVCLHWSHLFDQSFINYISQSISIFFNGK